MNTSTFLYIAFTAIAGLTFIACTDDDNDQDTLLPSIDLSSVEAFPHNCDTLYLGETTNLRFVVSDNAGLGSLGLSIHHNFDHHSHSTEIEECAEQPEKTPVNPLALIIEIPLPVGQKEYKVNYPLFLTVSDAGGNLDTGTYHMYLNLTDITGWTTQRGISIKVLSR